MTNRVVTAAAALAVALLAPAPARAAWADARPKIEAQLGIKVAAGTPDLVVGRSATATVVDPTKLAAAGLAGVKANDAAVVKMVGASDQYQVTAGGVTKAFAVNASGAVVWASAATTRPTDPGVKTGGGTVPPASGSTGGGATGPTGTTGAPGGATSPPGRSTDPGQKTPGGGKKL